MKLMSKSLNTVVHSTLCSTDMLFPPDRGQ